MEKIIFEKSQTGRTGVRFPASDVPKAQSLSVGLKRTHEVMLPELSELDVVRHFTRLSRLNFGVDTHFYPLGSCTMKYNPKVCEKVAGLKGLVDMHPLLAQIPQGAHYAQGLLEILYETEQLLCEMTGMSAFTLQPLAGAHGELTGVMLIAAYHRMRRNKKKYIIVPDSSHGTNPASAALAGYKVITIPSTDQGIMDLEQFKQALNPEVAAVMMTCPNTLGLFNPYIKNIAEMAHQQGALMYYDGANFNAILGKCRPGDLGFDVIHLNMHKTFATPHGSGGPGAGPVGVAEHLKEFLPVPRVSKDAKGKYQLSSRFSRSIGHIAPFYGNFGVIVKALAYIRLLGKEGLIRVSEHAVLNANYVMQALKPYFYLPIEKTCMHECVFSAKHQLANGVHALDIAKALIDKGFHPPTIYFPLIVKEALMIEPTETESRETLDLFIAAMKEIAECAKTNPDQLTHAPFHAPISRLDEVKAVKDMNVQYEFHISDSKKIT